MIEVCFDADIVRNLKERARLPVPAPGDRFGGLTVLDEYGYIISGTPRLTVLCACECGTASHAYVQYLRSGRAQSCGCQRARTVKAKAARRTYKRTTDPIYWIWSGMLQRCKPGTGHRGYAGRGIGVCPEWQEFAAFRAWSLANGFEPGLTIDRINNDGNYEPSNCRWTTWTVQARNTRRNVFIEAFGERKTVSAWATDPRCRAKAGTVYARLAAGYSHERALSEIEPLVGLTAFGETKTMKAWAKDPRCAVSYKVLWQRLNMNRGFTPETAITLSPLRKRLDTLPPSQA
jgi:hypothetical protein